MKSSNPTLKLARLLGCLLANRPNSRQKGEFGRSDSASYKSFRFKIGQQAMPCSNLVVSHISPAKCNSVSNMIIGKSCPTSLLLDKHNCSKASQNSTNDSDLDNQVNSYPTIFLYADLNHLVVTDQLPSQVLNLYCFHRRTQIDGTLPRRLTNCANDVVSDSVHQHHGVARTSCPTSTPPLANNVFGPITDSLIFFHGLIPRGCSV